MENLDKAINQVTDEEANRIYREVAEKGEDIMWEVIYEVVKAVGGFSNGSDIFDSGDTGLAAMLFDADEEEEFSMDEDNISSLKELYANHVIEKMGSSDIADTKSFKKLHKLASDDDIFKGTVEELAEVFNKATEFGEAIYEQLNQPRG